MIRRTLGRTGLEVTQLGYGSMGLRGPRTWGVGVVSDKDADEFLNRVLDAGINFIDTSPDYGISEQRIGEYIGSRRSKFILATKCGCSYTQHEDHLEIDHIWEPDVVRRNLEKLRGKVEIQSVAGQGTSGSSPRTTSPSPRLSALVRACSRVSVSGKRSRPTVPARKNSVPRLTRARV